MKSFLIECILLGKKPTVERALWIDTFGEKQEYCSKNKGNLHKMLDESILSTWAFCYVLRGREVFASSRRGTGKLHSSFSNCFSS